MSKRHRSATPKYWLGMVIYLYRTATTAFDLTISKITWFSHLWKNFIPPKYALLLWRLIQNRLPTDDNLRWEELRWLHVTAFVTVLLTLRMLIVCLLIAHLQILFGSGLPKSLKPLCIRIPQFWILGCNQVVQSSAI